MGETYTRRRMALGAMIGSPNSYRYLLVGLGALAAFWLAWSVFGWVPVAGDLIRGAAFLVTWLLATAGFGAALLSRAGLRENFAGRLLPPEALTDEYLWATPQFGVTAAKRPGHADPHAGSLMRRVAPRGAGALRSERRAPPRSRCAPSAPTGSGTARPGSTRGWTTPPGALRLAAGRPTELYRMDVLYDGERYVPVSDFDAARGGVGARASQASGEGGLRVVSTEPAPPDGLGDVLAQERPVAGRRRSARSTATSSWAGSG